MKVENVIRTRKFDSSLPNKTNILAMQDRPRSLLL